MRRPEKVAELVREEIVQIVGYELEDPRLAGVVVTDVRMSENLREARVFVTFVGTEEETVQGMRALGRSAPYVRRQLATSLSLRHAPQIFFVRDTVEERANRVDLLLGEIKHDEAPGPTEAAARERGDGGMMNDE